MNLSLNEVDAMAKKAARGAGYSWGLAEEAGKATGETDERRSGVSDLPEDSRKLKEKRAVVFCSSISI